MTSDAPYEQAVLLCVDTLLSLGTSSPPHLQCTTAFPCVFNSQLAMM